MGIAGLMLGIFGIVFGMFYTVLFIVFGSEGLKGIIENDVGGSAGNGI